MKRLLYILPFLFFAGLVSAQKYDFHLDPICWTVNGTDSSLFKITHLSSRGGRQIINYWNANLQTVSVIGGSLKNEYCDCLGNSSDVCTDPPLITDFQGSGIIVNFQNPNFGVINLSGLVYCASQADITFLVNGLNTPFNYSPVTNAFDAAVVLSKGVVYTFALNVTTPYGSDSQTIENVFF